MIDKKSNIVLMVSTAIFAVLSVCLMATFKFNEEFFDTHGRISALAQTEQENMLLESAKASLYKRNVNFSVVNQEGNELSLAISELITPEMVSVRDEFANKKLVLILEGAANTIKNETEIIADSKIMEAVGLYKQNDNVVLEIYTKEAYGYEIKIENGRLKIDFMPIRSLYDYIAVVYVPYEDKDRLYSEEWIKELNSIIGENSKLYLASSMQENYSEDQICDFANEIKADIVLGIDYESTPEPEYAEIIYNGRYFIPYFGSTDLASIEKKSFEEKTGVGVKAYIEAGEEDTLVNKVKAPVTMLKVYAQTQNEDIEDKYTLNHSIMEAINSIFKEIIIKE